MRWTTKSSTSLPLRSSAWALMPTGPRRVSAVRQLGDVAAKVPDVEPAARGAPHLGGPVAPEAAHQPPGPGPCQGRRGVAGPHPHQPVAVPRAHHQRGRAEQHLPVDRPGEVGAEEGQVRIRAPGRCWRAPARAARASASGRRRGPGRCAAPGRRRPRPRAGPPRLRRRRRRSPRRSSPRRAPRGRRRRRPSGAVTPQPGTTSPPAASTSAAKERATSVKSTTPVAGEWSAATPRACGSNSRISSSPIRRRPGTWFAWPRRSSSSSRGSSVSSAATISLPSLRASIPRSSQ